MFERVTKYFEGLKHVAAVKAQYYSKGQEDASSRFIIQQKNMTKKIEELTEQNIAIERRLRTSADQRIERMEQLHETRCSSCRTNLEAERQRLLRRQNQLARKIAEFEEVWLNMYQHANTIIDEHDILLRSSGRLVASRNVLLGFKKKVDQIMQESAPLLSIELHDSSTDKLVDLPPETLSMVDKNGKEDHLKKQN